MAPPAANGTGSNPPENLISVKFAQVSRVTRLPPLPFERRLGVGIIVWCVLFAIVIFIAFVATRMAAQNKEDGLHDTGLAIIEFGRA
ncbi:hypothetical protein ACCT30_45645, partial [Rhizobium ruizarguesonis]